MNTSLQSLRPVTIKQICTQLTYSKDNDIFYIDNKRVYRIEIVGTIEKIEFNSDIQDANRTLTINDYSGKIKVHFMSINNYDTINYILFSLVVFITIN